jgi:hypothetical protein
VVDTTKTQQINDTTAAIFLKSMRAENNFRRFFPGLSMLGKHFTVKKCHVDKITRQYTICNIMEKSVYAHVLKMVKV